MGQLPEFKTFSKAIRQAIFDNSALIELSEREHGIYFAGKKTPCGELVILNQKPFPTSEEISGLFEIDVRYTYNELTQKLSSIWPIAYIYKNDKTKYLVNLSPCLIDMEYWCAVRVYCKRNCPLFETEVTFTNIQLLV